MTMVTSTRAAAGGHRVADAVAHVSPLVVAVVLAVAVGRPLGWIAFVFPLGPLLVAGFLRLAGRAGPRGMRSLLAFSAVSALLVGGGWALTEAKDVWPPFSILFPLGLIAFLAGLVNFLMIVVSRTVRAARGQVLDYPWIPAPLAERIGLDPDQPE